MQNTVVRLAVVLSVGAVATPAPATAQDAMDVNGAVHDARMTGRMIRNAQRRDRGLPPERGPLAYTTRDKNGRAILHQPSSTHRSSRSQSNAAQTCADARAGRMAVSKNHPKFRKLLSLCRQAGL